MQASEGKPRTELGGCATGTWHSSIYNSYIIWYLALQYNLIKIQTHRHMIIICVHRSLHPIFAHLPYFQGVRRSQHTMEGGWRMEGVRSRANSGWVALVVSLIFLFVCLFCVWLEIGVLTIVIDGGWIVTAALSEIFTQPSPLSPLSPLSLLSPLSAVCCFQCNNIPLIF